MGFSSHLLVSRHCRERMMWLRVRFVYRGTYTSPPSTSTIITFTIPPSIPASYLCQLIFLLHGGRYTLSGNGFIVAYLLDDSTSNANVTTTAEVGGKMFMGWSQGLVGSSGEGFNLGGGACVAMRARGVSERVTFLEGVGGLNFTGYQTRGEPAVGVWLRVCEVER